MDLYITRLGNQKVIRMGAGVECIGSVGHPRNSMSVKWGRAAVDVSQTLMARRGEVPDPTAKSDVPVCQRVCWCVPVVRVHARRFAQTCPPPTLPLPVPALIGECVGRLNREASLATLVWDAVLRAVTGEGACGMWVAQWWRWRQSQCERWR